jgi:membrane-associated protease RseP (regulator of RpoE activity)
MSNETPQADGEPTPSEPEAPVPEAPAATTPPEPQQPQDVPTAETTPFTADDAVKSAGDEDDVAEPPAAASPAPTPSPATAPVAAAPAAAAPPAPAPTAANPEKPSGIFVPKWVGLVAAAIVAALVFGGIGYAIGDSSGSSDSRNAAAFPGNGRVNGNGPFGDGQGELPGGGNGQGQLPGNGNGNGNGPGQLPPNGNGNGGTAAGTAFLGVAVETTNGGVQITDVQSGSAAADAGLKAGDVVTAIDGTNVTTAAALQSAVRSHSSGDQITVTYTRGGQSTTAKVTLGTRNTGQSS